MSTVIENTTPASEPRPKKQRDPNQPKGKRGFASMDREKQREIASRGGKKAHENGTAHEFTREEAIAAGRKGGKALHANRRRQQAAKTENAAVENTAVDSPVHETRMEHESQDSLLHSH